MEKKVESLLRENEKLKNDLRQSRKNMFSAGSGVGSGSGLAGNNSGTPGLSQPTTFHTAMKGAYEKYSSSVNKSTILGPGGFSGALLNKGGDGSGTDRSTYLPQHH